MRVSEYPGATEPPVLAEQWVPDNSFGISGMTGGEGNFRDDKLFFTRDDMAMLTAAKRKKEPKSDFGLPGERKYPMPDWQHAANAKSRAKQQLKRGQINQDEYDRIVAKANSVMGRKK